VWFTEARGVANFGTRWSCRFVIATSYCWSCWSDDGSKGSWIHSWLGCYQMVATWMGGCLRTGKPSQCITNTMVNSAFHPPEVGKLSTSLFGWVMARHVHLCHSVALWWVSHIHVDCYTPPLTLKVVFSVLCPVRKHMMVKWTRSSGVLLGSTLPAAAPTGKWNSGKFTEVSFDLYLTHCLTYALCSIIQVAIFCVNHLFNWFWFFTDIYTERPHGRWWILKKPTFVSNYIF